MEHSVMPIVEIGSTIKAVGASIGLVWTCLSTSFGFVPAAILIGLTVIGSITTGRWCWSKLSGLFKKKP